MTEALTLFASLRRPRLMLRAARLGLIDYRRDRDLRRLLGTPAAPAPDQALEVLLNAEARIEAVRLAGDSTYSVTRHIDLLIAMLAEARLSRHRSGLA